ncbi:MAG: hypothetical protein C3F10_08800 [Dehalococcoidia bacterium]|nr:hypothetical protein [Dehalococcoidia bacterium]PWB45275.1 MAG: hypothetical protein C3F10_08800 [Dehalococcoidia bacterium]
MTLAAPGRGPALALVAPFFLAAPLGLALAGLILAFSNGDTLLAINAPRTVALTHAAVIGWLTMGIFGAVYQLGPAVLGGRLVSSRLARVHFFVHATVVPAFVWTFWQWDVRLMGYAASGLVLSFILFLINAFPAIGTLRRGALPARYLGASLVMLAVTAGFGITWAGTLQHLWFPVTMGRLAGHAHLGLLGWLGLTLMGVAYQLAPMFNVVQRKRPVAGGPILALTVTAALGGGLVLMADPGPWVRLAVAAAMAAGPGAWGIEMLRLMLARSRRTLDVQGRATFVSLGFLVVTICLGLLAAIGKPVSPGHEPTRLLLGYGIAGVSGWAGIMLIGNSYKILPFLVWYHRYRQLAGIRPVPVVADIYSEGAARAVLAVHTTGTIVAIAGALLGDLNILRAGGLMLTLGAALHMVSLAHIVLAPHAPAPRRIGPGEVATR